MYLVGYKRKISNRDSFKNIYTFYKKLWQNKVKILIEKSHSGRIMKIPYTLN